MRSALPFPFARSKSKGPDTAISKGDVSSIMVISMPRFRARSALTLFRLFMFEAVLVMVMRLQPLRLRAIREIRSSARTF